MCGRLRRGSWWHGARRRAVPPLGDPELVADLLVGQMLDPQLPGRHKTVGSKLALQCEGARCLNLLAGGQVQRGVLPFLFG